jgi:hypothetical protein
MDRLQKAYAELKEAIERVRKDAKRGNKPRAIPVPRVYKIVSRGPERWDR